MLVIEPGRLPRRFAVDQAVRPMRVELITQSRAIRSVTPPILAASVRVAPSQIAATAISRRACGPSLDRLAAVPHVCASKSSRSVCAWRTSLVRQLNQPKADLGRHRVTNSRTLYQSRSARNRRGMRLGNVYNKGRHLTRVRQELLVDALLK